MTDADLVLLDSTGERMDVEITSVPLLRGGRLVGVFGQARTSRTTDPRPPIRR